MPEGLFSYVGEIAATETLQGFGFERVELQIDFEVRHIGGQLLYEVPIVGDPDAVRIHHQVFDRPRLGQVEDSEEIGMDGRLAAAELDDVGRALAGDDGVEHDFD